MNKNDTNELVIMKSVIGSLNKKMQLFDPVLEAINVGIEICDEEGNVLYVNKKFSELSGIPKEHRLHKNIFDVHPDGVIADVIRTKQTKLNMITSTPGREGKAITSGYPLLIEGELVGVLLIIQDISETISLSRKVNQQQAFLTEIYRQTAQFVIGDLVSEEPVIKNVIEEIIAHANKSIPIAVFGETGTGKNVVAEAIHLYSTRNDKPFLRFDCSKYSEKEKKYHIFGYEKNAFPEAVTDKIGQLQLINGGTLYLDHVEHLSLEVQTEIVQSIKEGRAKSIGGTSLYDVDLRLIVSANSSFKELYENGLISEELYEYINQNILELPPLRKRKKDIPNLVNVFIKKYREKYGKKIKGINKEAIELLMEYGWVGNIIELENTIKRIILRTNSEVITKELIMDSLPFDFGDSKKYGVSSLVEAEKKTILKAIEYYGNSLQGKKQAAEALQISLGTLYNKMREYKL